MLGTVACLFSLVSFKISETFVDAKESVEVSSHSERGSEVANLDKITELWDTSNNSKSANLVRVPRYNRRKLVELNSEPEDLVKIRLLPVFTRYTYGILTECNDR